MILKISLLQEFALTSGKSISTKRAQVGNKKKAGLILRCVVN